MSKEEFSRLLNYTEYLVTHDVLPANIQPICRTNISNEHIRFTFYLLNKNLSGRSRHPRIVDFVHAVFAQFDNTSPKTTNQKFSTAPQSYHKDFTGYFGDLK